MRLINILLWLVVMVMPSYGLTQPINQHVQDAILPPPNTASLGKYGDIPVSYFTGVPSIRVPIHTISEGPLKIDIGLSYHAAGMRVSETASWVGSGWTLQAGGMVSRTIQGLPDEVSPAGYYHSGNRLGSISDEWDPNVFMDVLNGQLDGEPDLFSFSFAGQSGKFYIDKDHKVRLVPKQDIRIEPIINGSIDGFLITTKDGTRYHFGKVDNDSRTGYEETRTNGESGFNRSGWMLLQVETCDKHWKINLNYTPEHFEYKSPANCRQTLSSCLSGSGEEQGGSIECGSSLGYAGENHNYNRSQVHGQRLNSITVPSQTSEVLFIANTIREDLGNKLSLQSLSPKRLDAIEISHGDDLFCNRFNLNYSYWRDNRLPYASRVEGQRLRLESVRKVSCGPQGGMSLPATTFEYVGNDFFPHRLDKAIDHWGYYNGEDSNNRWRLNIPAGTRGYVPYQGSPGAAPVNRNSNFAHMSKGVLKKINYPTGGHTEFKFQGNTANKYVEGSPKRLLRLQSEVTSIGNENCGTDEITSKISTGSYAVNTFTPFDNINEINSATLRVGIVRPQNATCSSSQANKIKITVHLDGNRIGEAIIRQLAPGQNERTDNDLPLSLFGINFQPGVNYEFKLESEDAWGLLEINSFARVFQSYVVGGLRVHEIKNHDGLSTANDVVRKFIYSTAHNETISSGHLYYTPNYGSSAEGIGFSIQTSSSNLAGTFSGFVNTEVYAEQSVIPLSSPEGYHIGYERVVEQLADGSYTEHEYYLGNTASRTRVSNRYPMPPESVDHYAGRQRYVNLHSSSNTAVSTTQEAFEVISESNPTDRLIRLSPRINCTAGSATGTGNVPKVGVALITDYTIKSGAGVLKRSTKIIDNAKTVTTYGYDASVGYLQPTIVESSGDDWTRKSEFTYTYNLDDVVAEELIERFIIGAPVETKTYINGTQIGGSKLVYSMYRNSTGLPTTSKTDAEPYIHELHNFEMTWDVNNNPVDTGYERTGTIDSYKRGLITSFTAKGWLPTTYSWTNAGLLREENYNGFNKLRTYYSGTRLMQSSTEVDGSFTEYEYDELLRLRKISPFAHDGSNEIETTYEYNYSEALSQGQPNSILTKTNYKIHQDIASFTELDEQRSYQYMDGLGRPLQTVLQKGSTIESSSGTLLDQVTVAIKYDNLGRPAYAYVPFSSPNTNGGYQTPTADMDYTLTEYFDDPLGRVKRQTPPSWSATHFSYGSNTSDEVRKGPNTSEAYPPFSLLKQTTIDPEGKATEIFTDLRGRQILTRIKDANGTVLSDTYTSYDDKDRVIAVHPPFDGTYNQLLDYKYTYDKADNLISKKIPDTEIERYTYDERNLLVCTSNSSLPPGKSCLANVYDDFGRNIAIGFLEGPLPTGKIDQNTITSGNAISHTEYGNMEDHFLRNKILFQSSWAMNGENPTGKKLITYSTYDVFGRISRTEGNTLISKDSDAESFTFRYNPLGTPLETSHFLSNPTGFVFSQVRTKTDRIGRPVQELHRISKNDQRGKWQSISSYAYNDRGQVIKELIGGGSSSPLETTNFEYLPNGYLQSINDPLSPGESLFAQRLYYNDAPSSLPGPGLNNGNISAIISYTPNVEAFTQSFTYDAMDRLESVSYFSANSGIEIANYKSNYDYDIRGNLLKLNRWGRVNESSYGHIDDLRYEIQTGSNRIVNIVENKISAATVNGYNSEGSGKDYIYDRSGNIEFDPSRKLNIKYNYLNLPYEFRKDDGTIVSITYSSSGAKLAEVTSSPKEDQRIHHYFGDIELVNEEPYLGHHSKGRILLEPLAESPLDVRYGGCEDMEVPEVPTYPEDQEDIEGSKYAGTYDSFLPKDRTVFEGSETSTTADIPTTNAVGFTGQRMVKLQEGFSAKLGTQVLASTKKCPTSVTWQYEYYLKDHLGNTRVRFADLNLDGSIQDDEVLSEHHYYAFGMEMEGDWNRGGEEARYRYNGKELNEELGLYDYGFRWYDPAIGRFTGVDPISAEFPHVSTYNYAENEPIANIDLWGLQKVSAITMGGDVKYRGQWLAMLRDDVAHHHITNNSTATPDLVRALQAASQTDPAGIGFLAIFSHGIPGLAFGSGGGSGGMEVGVLGDLVQAINDGTITFAQGAKIYLGGCNCGTTWSKGNLAQALADITGADVIAAVNDQVTPVNESISPPAMVYSVGYPRDNQFSRFTPHGSPQGVGGTVDLLSLINNTMGNVRRDRAEASRRQRLRDGRSKIKPISPLPTPPIQPVQPLPPRA